LPAASSGFHLAMDTLAVRLTIPPAGGVRDFHPQVNAPLPGAQTKNPTIRTIVSWESSRRRREVNVRNLKGASKMKKKTDNCLQDGFV
ncbi:MAG: hypothetical protein M3X11_24675, partial [Acidobacteriota bacterium]|nr:hypothetical protein [Acidobacteriota bacterium]